MNTTINRNGVEDRLIDELEFARIAGVTDKTARLWRSQRKGPSFVKLGDGPKAAVRYWLSEVMRWLDERVVKCEQARDAEAKAEAA
ncbi:MAG: hypothetical protein AAGD00_04705 [Planctomycetota bacterium]